MLEFKNIQTGYTLKGNKTIVSKEINTLAQAGDFIAVLGPNGSGKSTLFKSILRNIPFLGGSCLLNGEELSNKKALAQQIAVVYTDKAFYSDINVEEFIALGRSPYTNWWGSLAKPDQKAITDAIESTKLQSFVHKQVNQLSDGEKQRVFIARALAQDTPVIILDEPTAHLDLPGRIEIQLLLRKLCQEKRKLVLMSTHDIDLSMQLASKVWLFKPNGDFAEGIAEDLVLNNTIESIFFQSSFASTSLKNSISPVCVCASYSSYLFSKSIPYRS